MNQRLGLLLLLTAAVSACGDSTPATGARAARYDVTVTRTALGIPHIKANDFGSIGYGYGYAFAEDNLCLLMEDFINIRGERSRYFGRDGSFTIFANGFSATNVDSDFFWKLVNTDAAIAPIKQKLPEDARAGTFGFTEGFNRYIRELKSGAHAGRHASCRGEPWLQEIAENDMYRRYYRLALLASSSVFMSGIAQAQPPPITALAPKAASKRELVRALKKDPGPLAFFQDDRALGSNMYALGSQATSSGIPMVFGNPHFPWRGTERLYISHLTVPGQADIMGSSLYGVPLVLIGFNDHFAWSHTVSTAYRFTFYELTLTPGDPTSYVYDGAILKMDAVPLSVSVKEADGSITEETRTLYKSRFGPMLGFKVSGQDILPWSTNKAYTLRDANAENDRLFAHFFAWNTAKSLDEFKQIQRETVAVPWVNTVAAGPGGKAYYADITNIPNVPDAKAQMCGTSAQAQALAQVTPGLAVLDGSRSDCDWDTDADAPAPGIFGPGNLPSLERDDWVHNCNDSYWLTHPDQRLEGFDKIIGPERTARSLRTRLCILQVQRHLDADNDNDFDADNDHKFSLKELQDTVLSSQIYSAQLARDDVVADVCAAGSVLTQSGPVDVADACTVLAAWDMKSNLDSVGSHIWREFWRRAAAAPGGLPLSVPAGAPWLTPFSATNPVNTPNTLNTASPLVQQALGDAVRQIGTAEIALNAPLGTLQRSGVIGDTNIPIFGGTGTEGAFTIVSAPSLSDQGYPVNFGNSYIQTVTWEPEGSGFKPIAEGFITYSQSTDPANPHYADFTREYSAKRWHRFPFRPAEIEASMVSRIHLTN